MESFVSEITEFQKRLFWFSNVLGAAILNNIIVTCYGCSFIFTQRAFVLKQ